MWRQLICRNKVVIMPLSTTQKIEFSIVIWMLRLLFWFHCYADGNYTTELCQNKSMNDLSLKKIQGLVYLEKMRHFHVKIAD